jgi:hypothetical protein
MPVFQIVFYLGNAISMPAALMKKVFRPVQKLIYSGFSFCIGIKDGFH